MPPSLLEKKDKNLRKSKNEKKMERKKGYILFPLSCNFSVWHRKKKKIPSSSVRSLSPKSSVFFFVRGPIRTKKEKIEENKMTKNTQAFFSRDKKIFHP
jgi:hypothetical protein